MAHKDRIAVIGAGAMGAGIIAALIAKKVVSCDRITATAPRMARLEELKSLHGIQTTTNNKKAIKDADVVIVGVKPQTLGVVMEELGGSLSPETLLISIIAGASIANLRAGFKHEAIVRSMPNTPAQVGHGITVWTATDLVNEERRSHAAKILGAFGEEIYVQEEDYLDMATALSGNGPAYVFLFIEAMVNSGVHLGFPRHIAEKLVLETIKGSIAYVEQSERHLASLRYDVTSPGGTAAEALYFLEREGFRTAIARAIWAGYHRSVELGQGKRRSQLDRT
jgi:pyrroline-5-carboxylate reductase